MELDQLIQEIQSGLTGSCNSAGGTESPSAWQESVMHREEIWTEMRAIIMEAKLSFAHLSEETVSYTSLNEFSCWHLPCLIAPPFI